MAWIIAGNNCVHVYGVKVVRLSSPCGGIKVHLLGELLLGWTSVVGSTVCEESRQQMQQWRNLQPVVWVPSKAHPCRGIWGVPIPGRSRILLMFVQFVVVTSPWSPRLCRHPSSRFGIGSGKVYCTQRCMYRSPLWWATGSDLFLKVNVILQPWRSLESLACLDNCGAMGEQISHLFWGAHGNYTDKHVWTKVPSPRLWRCLFLV